VDVGGLNGIRRAHARNYNRTLAEISRLSP
jgi:hypothetical protein